MFPGIIFRNFPNPPLTLREHQTCYCACSVRRDSTLEDLSLEQKTILHELETSSERKTKEEITVWSLTELKENKVGSQEPEEEFQGFL